MRLDDPIILQRIEQLEDIAAGLRMAAGFPPLHPTPETTASRIPIWCPIDGCHRGAMSRDDLEHHLRIDHGQAA